MASHPKEPDSAYVYGGAIYNFNGKQTITNSIFANNSAYSYSNEAWGGAIANMGKDSEQIIKNSIFSGNSVSTKADYSSTYYSSYGESYGGAISNNQGTQTIENSIFTNNSVDSTDRWANGGAAYNYQGTQTISGSIFKNNSATSTYNAYGGADL